jgi:ABC-type proline/glycine betaine transport system ATPase subunit
MASQHILFIIRGLPGSGKSTLGRSIRGLSGGVPDCLSADDYFVGADGVYRFSPSGLPGAHADRWCLSFQSFGTPGGSRGVSGGGSF